MEREIMRVEYIKVEYVSSFIRERKIRGSRVCGSMSKRTHTVDEGEKAIQRKEINDKMNSMLNYRRSFVS